MTPDKTPSDAEIATLYADETGFALGDSPAALLDFARAVLAKWGSVLWLRGFTGARPLSGFAGLS